MRQKVNVKKETALGPCNDICYLESGGGKKKKSLGVYEVTWSCYN